MRATCSSIAILALRNNFVIRASSRHCHRFWSTRTEINASTVGSHLKELRLLDTASLCDADKSLRGSNDYQPLKLLDSIIRPMNQCGHRVMAGVARTVQCTEANDFLAVLRGLQEACQDEVLVVNTLSSNRAVAGELFCVVFIERKGNRCLPVV